MSCELSPNAKAILLLTAPLLAGSGRSTADLLSFGEYRRLARRLRDLGAQPADLLGAEAARLLADCAPAADPGRLERLLSRGLLLAEAHEHWQARAIWVVSRADAAYPQRLKKRLRGQAPPVIYGCGDRALLDGGGLAVVGSRHVDEELLGYSRDVGRLAAAAGRPIVSGGAKGVDRAAMEGALDAGGRALGVLANRLERAALDRGYREALVARRLALVSPFDPKAGFNVGHAMQRNKLIYAFAEAALVVQAEVEKGGTWAGATEELDRESAVPVFVRADGSGSAGLDALRARGARPWPEPRDVGELDALLRDAPPSVDATPAVARQAALFQTRGPKR